MSPPTLSVVIPCFNEEDVLERLRARLVPALDALGVSWEAILVDDGSRDRTLEILTRMHGEDPRLRIVGFSRNFGHQAAVSAGLTYARGEAVAVMDADLQDPPELLAKCLERWREGYHVVYAVRATRKESLWKRAAYMTFYRLLRSMADVDVPLDSGDFCLMDRRVVRVLCSMPERNMFIRGLRAWSGFKQIGLPYDRDERAAGATKYSLTKLFRLAADGVLSLSTVPLRLATWLGLVAVAFSMLGLVLVVLWRITGVHIYGMSPTDARGWAGVMVAAFFFGGVQLLVLGVMGEYLARIYEEVKSRPRWIVGTRLGVEAQEGRVE